MSFYLDIILPLPLERQFTYSVTREEAEFLKPGMRVAVPFGKSKIYTGIVAGIHNREPQLYEARPIEQILDEYPVVTSHQLGLWSWIARYYMCAEGEVLRAALPGAFLLESETLIQLSLDVDLENLDLNDQEYLIVEALQTQSSLKIKEVMLLLDKKTVLPVINSLVSKKAIIVNQEIFEQYKPKMIRYVKLAEKFSSEAEMHKLLDELSKAPKQRDAVLSWFNFSARSKKPVKLKELSAVSGASPAIMKTLIDRGIFTEYYIQTDRVQFDGEVTNTNLLLNEWQQEAFDEIESIFAEDEVCLLHGITS
ncbi:MAG TPA: hypothetical protein VLN72_02320, partial [Gillisia sp.]|nr:hypothetical protein [Gillisia sp.]